MVVGDDGREEHNVNRLILWILKIAKSKQSQLSSPLRLPGMEKAGTSLKLAHVVSRLLPHDTWGTPNHRYDIRKDGEFTSQIVDTGTRRAVIIEGHSRHNWLGSAYLAPVVGRSRCFGTRLCLRKTRKPLIEVTIYLPLYLFDVRSEEQEAVKGVHALD